MAVRPGEAAGKGSPVAAVLQPGQALSGAISPELASWPVIPRSLGPIPRNQPACRALYWQPVAHSPLPVLGRLSRA